MIIFRVLDIETIPDNSVWSKHAESVTWKLSPGSWHEVHKNHDARVERVEGFAPPQAHRVVALSYVDVTFDPEQVPRWQYDRCYTECRWSRDESGLDAQERMLLSEFNAAMTAHEGAPQVHLVSWNGRSFDLPVIVLRSLKHRLACPWYYVNRDVRYRYSPEGHLDLMDFLSDYGASRQMTLHDACRLVGLPGKTGEVSGGNVFDLYKTSLNPEADIEKIQKDVATYCLSDSIQTALLFLRSRHHLGKVSADTHNAALATFEASPSIVAAVSPDWNALKV